MVLDTPMQQYCTEILYTFPKLSILWKHYNLQILTYKKFALKAVPIKQFSELVEEFLRFCPFTRALKTNAFSNDGAFIAKIVSR